MTQRRNDPDAISNYFDRLLQGIGHRGSSFTDIDGATHDEATDRFLFQEFKRPGEQLNIGQRKFLKALARREYLTVWCVRAREDGHIDWCDVATRRAETITEAEYQARFRRWWNQEAIVNGNAVVVPIEAPRRPLLIMASEIFK
jgi:hypothetical protein